MITLKEIIKANELTFFDANIINDPHTESVVHHLMEMGDIGVIDIGFIERQELRKRFVRNLLVNQNIEGKKFVTTEMVAKEIEVEQKLASGYLHDEHTKYKQEHRKKKGERNIVVNFGSIESYLEITHEVVKRARRNIYYVSEDPENKLVHELVQHAERELAPLTHQHDRKAKYHLIRVAQEGRWTTDADLLATAIYAAVYQNKGVAVITNDSGIHKTFNALQRLMFYPTERMQNNELWTNGDGKRIVASLKNRSVEIYSDLSGNFECVSSKPSYNHMSIPSFFFANMSATLEKMMYEQREISA